MENKKLVPQWLSILMFALLAIAFAATIITIPQTVSYGAIQVGTKIVYCLAYLAAFAYALAGYKKKAVGFYKIVCVLYTAAVFIGFCARLSADVTGDAMNVFSLIVAVIQLVVVCTLTIAEDLGRKKSFICAGINLLCTLIFFFVSLARSSTLMLILAVAGEIFLAFVFGIMVYAKYQDKIARGREV